MTKNTDEIERHQLSKRPEAMQIGMELIGAIHGTLNPEGSPASLIVLEVRFTSPKQRERRIARAGIKVLFSPTTSGDPGPEVYRIAPEGCFGYRPRKPPLSPELMKESGQDCPSKLTGSRVLKARAGPKNAAIWEVEASEGEHNGIPELLRVVILLRRRSHEKFEAKFTFNTVVHVGIQAHQVPQHSTGTNTVLFDPSHPPISFEELHRSIDLQNLDLVDQQLLQQWVRVEFPVQISTTVQDEFFVELWNIDVTSALTIPTPSLDLELGENVPEFEGLLCKQWKRLPDEELLQRHFSWVEQEQTDTQTVKKICSVLYVIQSSAIGMRKCVLIRSF